MQKNEYWPHEGVVVLMSFSIGRMTMDDSAIESV